MIRLGYVHICFDINITRDKLLVTNFSNKLYKNNIEIYKTSGIATTLSSMNTDMNILIPIYRVLNKLSAIKRRRKKVIWFDLWQTFKKTLLSTRGKLDTICEEGIKSKNGFKWFKILILHFQFFYARLCQCICIFW